MTLENTVIVIAPLIPWSIAGTVPLATVSAPITALLAACYLYLLPVWNYFPARHEAPAYSIPTKYIIQMQKLLCF